MELQLASTGHGAPSELLTRSLCVCVPPVMGGSCKSPISESSQGCQGTMGQGLGTGQDRLEHRHRLNHVFLLAGVDTTSGLPHPLVPTDHVLLVLQEGA